MASVLACLAALSSSACSRVSAVAGLRELFEPLERLGVGAAAMHRAQPAAGTLLPLDAHAEVRVAVMKDLRTAVRPVRLPRGTRRVAHAPAAGVLALAAAYSANTVGLPTS